MNQDDRPPEETPSVQKCSACGADLPQNTRFCPACGTPATDICPSCGEKVQPSESFCSYCGTQVSAFARDRTSQPPTQQVSAGSAVESTGRADESVAPPLSPPAEGDLRSVPQRPISVYRPVDALAITCPRCGAQGGAGDSFCNSCGLPLDEQETAGPNLGAGVAYAGLLVRFVARLIDAVIVSSAVIAILLLVGTDTFFEFEDEVAFPRPVFYIVGIVMPWIYHAGFVALWSQTPGKRVMGLRVEPTFGAQLGFGKPILREAVIQAPSLLVLTPFALGGGGSFILLVASVVIALSRPDRRMLHDLVAGTAVVRDRP